MSERAEIEQACRKLAESKDNRVNHKIIGIISRANGKELRNILYYRFVQGLTWEQTAKRLGYRNGDGVRIIYNRFYDSKGNLKKK